MGEFRFSAHTWAKDDAAKVVDIHHPLDERHVRVEDAAPVRDPSVIDQDVDVSVEADCLLGFLRERWKVGEIEGKNFDVTDIPDILAACLVV